MDYLQFTKLSKIEKQQYIDKMLQKASEMFGVPLDIMTCIYDIETLTEEEAYEAYGDKLTEIEAYAEQMPLDWRKIAENEIDQVMESYTYTKKDIRNMVLAESKGYMIFEKKDLHLIENDGQDTSYASSMDDLSDAKDDSITNDVVINRGNTDDTFSTTPTTFDIEANSVADAQRQIRQNNADPVKKSIQNVNYKVHFESVRRNSIPYTKAELNELLKKY